MKTLILLAIAASLLLCGCGGPQTTEEKPASAPNLVMIPSEKK